MKNRIGRWMVSSACCCLLFAASSSAQESGSKPATSSPSAAAAVVSREAPASALSAVLAAACSQTQTEFTRFLTARNKDAFSRMTPSARVALMKRFVLLNEPGKTTVSANPSGRPMVRCETSGVTTEMQIGGAEIHDNLAFLPMDLRDITDSTGIQFEQVAKDAVLVRGGCQYGKHQGCFHDPLLTGFYRGS